MDKRYLDLLKKGADFWNKWREENPDQKVNLSGSQLSRRDLSKFDLRNVDLSGADLTKTDLTNAKLENSSLSRAILFETKLPKRHLFGTDLSGTDLSFSDLSGAILTNANLSQANLKGASFRYADLTNTNLVETLAVATDFSGVDFTGACIENWCISNETSFEEVTCDYIYLKIAEINGSINFRERRPSNITEIFSLDEFAILVKKILKTIDLIFVDGIDWQAFFSSFQELSKTYKNNELSIQAIERKNDSFIVRLEVSVTSDEAEIEAKIEAKFKAIYRKKLKLMQDKYEQKLKCDQLESLKHFNEAFLKQCQQNTDLIKLAETMANNQTRSIFIQNSRFGGGFAADNAYQNGGEFNDYSIIIGQNINEIESLVNSIRDNIQSFPKQQQEESQIELDDLESDINAPEKHEVSRFRKRLKGLLAAGTAAMTVAGGAATFSGDIHEFTNNVLALGEKLGIMPEEIQPSP